MGVPFKSKDKNSKQKSLQVLNDQLVLAKSEGDTRMVKIIKIMIDRIKNLKDS